MSFGLRNGTIFAGRYKVLHCIATGGMGAVYEVIHLETERRRALKVMLPQAFQSADLRERFKREARVAARVESEFIVDVFDAGVDEATGMPFLVMELLRGEELGKRLTRAGRLPPSEVMPYLYQTALALDRSHKAGIVHRDLKPENLFLTDREDGRPRIKVLDFGVAKLLAESAATGGKQPLGTPLYMSPEQFNVDLQLSGATDIYALGMIAYTLLVGAAYWEDDAEKSGNLFSFAMLVMQGPRERPSVRAARRGVRLPPAFDVWFARATAVDPAQRFRMATEAVSLLAEALELVVAQPRPMEQFHAAPSWPAPPMEIARPAYAEPRPEGAVGGPSPQAPGGSLALAPTLPLAQGPTPIGTSVTGWGGEQRMRSIVVGAMVLGSLILCSTMLVWWKIQRAPLRGGAAEGSAAPPVASFAAPPAASSAAPPPSRDPLSTSGASAAPQPPPFDATPEPSLSSGTPGPTPNGRKVRPPLRKLPPKPAPTRYSQD
jgi:eukaryotic-like serine/threonine-protein kinase